MSIVNFLAVAFISACWVFVAVMAWRSLYYMRRTHWWNRLSELVSMGPIVAGGTDRYVAQWRAEVQEDRERRHRWSPYRHAAEYVLKRAADRVRGVQS